MPYGIPPTADSASKLCTADSSAQVGGHKTIRGTNKVGPDRHLISPQPGQIMRIYNGHRTAPRWIPPI